MLFLSLKSGSMNATLDLGDGCKINRLDAIKRACIERLNDLNVNQASKRLALITFSDKIKYYCDGNFVHGIMEIYNRLEKLNIRRASDITLDSLPPNNSLISSLNTVQVPYFNNDIADENSEDNVNYFTDKEMMLELGASQYNLIRPLRDSFLYLEQNIKNLSIEGSTALGIQLKSVCVIYLKLEKYIF
jgi:hypothetical protein